MIEEIEDFEHRIEKRDIIQNSEKFSVDINDIDNYRMDYINKKLKNSLYSENRVVRVSE